MNDGINSAWIGLGGSSLGTDLQNLLMCDAIQPGSEPSYQICKTIYTQHPLGGKMAEGPISLAQSQERKIAVQEAPEEVLQAFKKEWTDLEADSVIHNLMSLSRVYGLASMGIMIEGEKETNTPLDMTKIWDKDIAFNVWDPLNTSGSLVLNQIPTAFDFAKPRNLSVAGQPFHRSRYQVVMNEHPVYIAYTGSAFGFVGRSVYQRALYPLKSFVRSMIADDMIAKKLGLIISKQKSPGSIVDRLMQSVNAIKRNILKQGETDNVLAIDIEEAIETLDMQNTDGAGTYSRTNIIRNIETAADMPAKMLEQETLSSGLADGTEDGRIIARYIERIRMKMVRPYGFMNNVAQYRAWNPQFHQRMVAKYPDSVPKQFEDAFSMWRQNFKAEWPSLLIEPPSETIKTEQVKLEAVISILNTLLPVMDPMNKAKLIQDALDNISENQQMFAHEFAIDPDELLDWLESQAEKVEDQHEMAMESTKMQAPPAPKQLPKLGRVK